MKKLLLAIIAMLFSVLALAAVNINNASKEELDSLKGIGPVKAQAIIDYRNQNGPFKSIDDIKKVKGIGDKTFDAIKSDITVSGATSAPAKKEEKKAAEMKPAEPKKTEAAPAMKKEEPKAAEAKKTEAASAKEAMKKDEKTAAKDEMKKTDDEKKAAKEAKKKAREEKKAAKEAKKTESDKDTKTSDKTGEKK